MDAVLSADVAAHRGDRDRVEKPFYFLVRSGSPFTADHVDKLVSTDGGGPYNRLLIAVVMLTAARRGEITEVFDRRPVASTRRSRHGAKLRWWRGITAENEAAA
ncbi:hypothetical protein [Amycolatopsis lexingtonensis]|uniref:hypothetical protein n=1 Tax=Amycolatopsis lexingtonensis TaxID=218822 RepID=UPI001178889C|nr:hypothetical protein [Amycolatopsis lexingtonensis]